MGYRGNELSWASGWLAACMLLTACGGSSSGLPTPAGASETTADSVASSDGEVLSAEERDVDIPAAGLSLSGTLSLPDRPPHAPVPAVVLVHGSGPHSRNPRYPGQLGMAFGFDVPVFQQLTERLLEDGNAVLRYDKRSCGSFNGCADNAYPTPAADLTIDAFVDDVEAAVDYLASLADIDSERIFLVGHSQGAKLALSVVARSPAVRAAVMLAANHQPVDALLAHQLEFSRRQLAATGRSPVRVEQVLDLAVELLERVQAAREGRAAPDTIFLKSWIELDDQAPALVQSLNRPLLAVAGDYDWNVPAEELQAWQSTFDDVADDPGHRTQLVPCVTHALNCITEPDPIQLGPEDLGRDLHPAVANLVAEFVQSQR